MMLTHHNLTYVRTRLLPAAVQEWLYARAPWARALPIICLMTSSSLLDSLREQIALHKQQPHTNDDSKTP